MELFSQRKTACSDFKKYFFFFFFFTFGKPSLRSLNRSLTYLLSDLSGYTQNDCPSMKLRLSALPMVKQVSGIRRGTYFTMLIDLHELQLCTDARKNSEKKNRFSN